MRAVRIAVAAAAVTALSGVALFSTADAGVMPLAAPLTVNKVVEGAVPPGTTFSVLVACDGDIIDDGMGIEDEAGGLSAQGKGPGGLSSVVLTFDETGAPTSGPNPVGFVGPGSCTVTETAAGGASTIGYTCDGQIPADQDPPVAKDGPSAQGGGMFTDPCGPIVTNVPVSIEEEDQFAVVTVINTFSGEAAVTPALVLTPAFTG